MPYIEVYRISDPSATQNERELTKEGNYLVVWVDEDTTVGSFKERVAKRWPGPGRYYGMSGYRRYNTEILRGNDNILLLCILRSLKAGGIIKKTYRSAVVIPPVAPDSDNVQIVRRLSAAQAFEERTAAGRANAVVIHASDSESEDNEGPPPPKRQRRIKREVDPNEETPGGDAQDDKVEEEAAVEAAAAEGAARGNGGKAPGEANINKGARDDEAQDHEDEEDEAANGGPVPKDSAAVGADRGGGDDIPQGADVDNEDKVNEAAVVAIEEGRNSVNDANGGEEEEENRSGKGGDDDDAAGPPLLLWLRGLEVDGTAPGRFERYALDFQEHFGSLRALALAADEPGGMDGIFRDCNVNARGDRAMIRWAIDRLRRPE